MTSFASWTPLYQSAYNLAHATINGALKRLEKLRPEELLATFSELRGLECNKPCNYSLPGIGAAYSLYFHGRRTYDAANCLIDGINALDSPVECVRDFGSGTGAVLSALILLAKRDPPVQVREYCGWDISPEMVDEARSLNADLFPEVPRNILDGLFQVAPGASTGKCPALSTVTCGYVTKSHLQSDALLSFMCAQHATSLIAWGTSTHSAHLAAVSRSLQAQGWRKLPGCRPAGQRLPKISSQLMHWIDTKFNAAPQLKAICQEKGIPHLPCDPAKLDWKCSPTTCEVLVMKRL